MCVSPARAQIIGGAVVTMFKKFYDPRGKAKSMRVAAELAFRLNRTDRWLARHNLNGTMTPAAVEDHLHWLLSEVRNLLEMLK